MQDRTLDAENVQAHLSALDSAQDFPSFFAGLLADAWVPKQLNAGLAQLLEPAGSPPFEDRHCAAAAAAGVQPNHSKRTATLHLT
jgi:hypothetical protein